MNSMKAMLLEAPGRPLRAADLPQPQPSAGQLLLIQALADLRAGKVRGAAVLGVAVLGVAVLGVAVLGVAVLGVAVLGVAVLGVGS